MPFRINVKKDIEKVSSLEIEIIAPSLVLSIRFQVHY